MANYQQRGGSRKEGNHPNIYGIGSGWYLNMEFAGETHREAFTTARFGSREAALQAAIDTRDTLQLFRAEIEQAVMSLNALSETGGREEAVLKWLDGAVRRKFAAAVAAEQRAMEQQQEQPS